MKFAMIAALAAAQLSAAAAPAQAAEPPRQEAAAEPARFDARTELALADVHASAAAQTDAAREDEPRKKKRKSAGDKVLTGAAVVLGIGAVAVGGLLVAIFVN
jgi:hypothetical protein